MVLISFFVPSLEWWFGRFMPNHEQAQRGFILSCNMLKDTYPREYNKFEIRVVVHISMLFSSMIINFFRLL
jgi:hypothetical protein